MSIKSIATSISIVNRKRLDNDIILTFSNGLKIICNLKDWNLNNINAKILAVVDC